MKRRETPCAACGMVPRDGTNHPYLACLAFKACKDAKTVEDNLAFVQSRAAQAERHRLEAEFKRELRRARGRTLGYCARPKFNAADSRRGGLFSLMPIFKPGLKTADGLTCRVVLVKRGAAKGGRR